MGHVGRCDKSDSGSPVWGSQNPFTRLSVNLRRVTRLFRLIVPSRHLEGRRFRYLDQIYHVHHIKLKHLPTLN